MQKLLIRSLILLLCIACLSVTASEVDISAAPTNALLNDYRSTSAPTSLTDICVSPSTSASGDCWVGYVVVSNPTASAITLLAQDHSGTPFKLFPTVSIAANSVSMALFQPTGLRMIGGLKIQASVTGLHVAIHSRVLP